MVQKQILMLENKKMFLPQATVMATLGARSFLAQFPVLVMSVLETTRASRRSKAKYFHLLCTRNPGYVMPYIPQNIQNLIISCFCFPRDGYALYKEL